MGCADRERDASANKWLIVRSSIDAKSIEHEESIN